MSCFGRTKQRGRGEASKCVGGSFVLAEERDQALWFVGGCSKYFLGVAWSKLHRSSSKR